MGIKCSSTRTLILEDALVPKENVLGEIGKGHVIAFNILNIPSGVFNQFGCDLASVSHPSHFFAAPADSCGNIVLRAGSITAVCPFIKYANVTTTFYIK